MIALLFILIFFLGLFLLGVKPATLLILIVLLSLISLLFCTIFFLISATILLFGKKSTGEFLHVETNGNRAYAWYRITGTEKEECFSDNLFANISEKSDGKPFEDGLEKNSGVTSYKTLAHGASDVTKQYSDYSDLEMMMEMNDWARTQAIKHRVIQPEQYRKRAKTEPHGEVRALFPTDTIIQDKFYHEGVTKLSVLQLGRKMYVLDGSTKLIIYLGLPLFSFLFIILGILFLELF